MRLLDTYILIEIANGNSTFKRYTDDDFSVTDLTLAEFYAVLLRKFNEKTANYWASLLTPYARAVPKEILFTAMRFRQAHKRRNISFFDAQGYAFALHHQYPFATGDKEFEDMKGVEFVGK